VRLSCFVKKATKAQDFLETFVFLRVLSPIFSSKHKKTGLVLQSGFSFCP